MRTLRGILHAYQKSSRWWLTSRPNPKAVTRLVCFPYAGGAASIFHSWNLALPERVEVCAVQLPGRANRIAERPFTRIPNLVDEVASALLPLFDKPCAFFGHSMGAILSFEVARWLRRNKGELPKRLFVSGRRAPQIPNTEKPTHQMSDEDFLSYIEQLKGTPEQVFRHPELVQLLLRVLRADSELCETYTYTNETPLACPISAFCGKSDEEETCTRLDAWRLQTSATFSLHSMDGGHFFLHSDQRGLLRILRNELIDVA